MDDLSPEDNWQPPWRQADPPAQEDDLLAQPRLMGGIDSYLIAGIRFAADAVREALPPPLVPAEGMTGGMIVYRARRNLGFLRLTRAMRGSTSRVTIPRRAWPAAICSVATIRPVR